jgi:serine protease inhibitor
MIDNLKNYVQASNSHQTPNLVMCPLSPQLLLGYLSQGSTGETQNEIKRVIKYSGPSQMEHLIRSVLTDGSNKELQFATAFFIANKFLYDFLKQNITFFLLKLFFQPRSKLSIK